jgi:hypothetical protein
MRVRICRHVQEAGAAPQSADAGDTIKDAAEECEVAIVSVIA